MRDVVYARPRGDGRVTIMEAEQERPPNPCHCPTCGMEWMGFKLAPFEGVRPGSDGVYQVDCQDCSVKRERIHMRNRRRAYVQRFTAIANATGFRGSHDDG